MASTLVGRYAKGEADVAGDALGLVELAEALGSGQRRTVLLKEPEKVEPYDRPLTALEIEPNDGPVIQSLDGSILRFAGTPDGLASIAEGIRGLASGTLGPHIHQEYYSGHPFYDPTTLPLTISVIETS